MFGSKRRRGGGASGLAALRLVPQWLQELLRTGGVPQDLRIRDVELVLDAFQGGWFNIVRPVSFTGSVVGAAVANTVTPTLTPDGTQWPAGWWLLLIGGVFVHTAGAGAVNIVLDVRWDASPNQADWASYGPVSIAAASRAGLANFAAGAMPIMVPPRAGPTGTATFIRNIDAIAGGDSVTCTLSGFAIPAGFKPL